MNAMIFHVRANHDAWYNSKINRRHSQLIGLNFDEFDELIEKICPTITFLQYKKLYKNCVRMEERDNSDYYSSTREAYWRCDLKELWNMLDEMGLNPVKEE